MRADDGAGDPGDPRPVPSAARTRPAPPEAWTRPAPSEARSMAQTALILGVLGIVVSISGLVLGPIALSQAERAEDAGADATAGRVLGWLATAFGGLTALSIGLNIVFLIVVLPRFLGAWN